MLTSPTRLLDELNRIDEDLSLLRGRRVALLGFRDSNVKRVADNVDALQAAADWTIVDLRAPQPGPVNQALAPSLAAPRLAMLVDTTEPLPVDALQLIGALHDARNAVRWADNTESALPDNRMLYVIASGARDITELPHRLKRIDSMAFISAPQ
jgi:hypothetical protein